MMILFFSPAVLYGSAYIVPSHCSLLPIVVGSTWL